MKSSHFDNKGQARIIDISRKKVTQRTAVASGKIFMKASTLQMIKSGSHKKGDVLALARIAGIMGSKQTSNLVPLCHPINIEFIEINFITNEKNNFVEIISKCKTTNKTGIEIEALTAVSIAALTIYDMCKSVDRSMSLESIKLNLKSGGKSGTFRNL